MLVKGKVGAEAAMPGPEVVPNEADKQDGDRQEVSQETAMIAMSLTDKCKFKANLATRFYDVVEQKKMETNQANNTVVNFLEEELGEDNLYIMVRAWNDGETYQRKPGISIKD